MSTVPTLQSLVDVCKQLQGENQALHGKLDTLHGKLDTLQTSTSQMMVQMSQLLKKMDTLATAAEDRGRSESRYLSIENASRSSISPGRKRRHDDLHAGDFVPGLGKKPSTDVPRLQIAVHGPPVVNAKGETVARETKFTTSVLQNSRFSCFDKDCHWGEPLDRTSIRDHIYNTTINDPTYIELFDKYGISACPSHREDFRQAVEAKDAGWEAFTCLSCGKDCSRIILPSVEGIKTIGDYCSHEQSMRHRHILHTNNMTAQRTREKAVKAARLVISTDTAGRSSGQE